MSRPIQILLMILAVVAGLFVGGILNMGVLSLIPKFFPYPEGVDPNVPENIADFMKTAPIGAFMLVWLAHWGQAFVGAIIAALIAPKSKMICALIVGVLTLVGGVLTVFMIPSPVWNVVIDLLGYLPIAWLGAKLVGDRGMSV